MALFPAVPAPPVIAPIPFRIVLLLVATTATLIAGLHVGNAMEFFSLTAIAISSALGTIGIIITGNTVTGIVNTTGPTKLRLDVSHSQMSKLLFQTLLRPSITDLSAPQQLYQPWDQSDDFV